MGNLLNKEDRIAQLNKIREEQKDENFGTINLYYQGAFQPVKVYKIPLNCLVYNPLNGRIASRVISYKKEYHELNNENEEDIKIIEKFLWESKEDRNQITMDDLRRNGQIHPGVIDKEGKIVDGNRRASLIRKIYRDKNNKEYEGYDFNKFNYFLAAILDKELSNSEMLELEMQIQNEDAVLDYNAIEKYLKCDQLKEHFTNTEIKTLMRFEKEKDVEDCLEIKKLMDEYLKAIGYADIYTCLEGKEDMFIGLNNTLKKLSDGGRGTKNIDWSPDEFDLADLKNLSFNVIRYGTDSGDEKKYRMVTGAKSDGFFYSKNIWQKYKEICLESIDQINKDEETLDDLRQDRVGEISAIIKSRDDAWKQKTGSILKNGMGKCQSLIDIQKETNMPELLLQKITDILTNINTNIESFYSEEIHVLLKRIGHDIYELTKINEKGKNN